MESQTISIRGAAEHNLKKVDLDIPKNKLVVFTGVSGSGKSSLAFDTLFAEGQRRYVESLSAYARQFLGQLDKPHYDSVRGLTPTIAVSQGSVSRNPRSTVGTMTEISDYLRVLFARVGVQHCYRCGQVVKRQSAAEIVERLREMPLGTSFILLAPLVRERKGSQAKLLDEVRKGGFSRVRVNGEVCRLEELLPLDKNRKHTIEVVIDRMRQRGGIAQRLTDSVETCLKVGQGRLICAPEAHPPQFFSERLSCPDCDISLPDLVPASFSFNSPLGMCSECNGLGSLNKMDTKLVVPDPSLSLREGAIHPWAKLLANSKSWNAKLIVALAKQRSFDLDTPWRDLSAANRHVLLYGNDESFEVQWKSERIEGRITMEWEGAIPAMMRRLKETKSEQMRKYYLSYMSDGECPVCSGSRLRRESRAVRVGPHGIADFNRVSVQEGLGLLSRLQLEGNQELIGRELLKEITNRLGFLSDVGLGYLSLDRRGDTLSGGEGQRIRLASQLGGELTGVTYVLDEPSIGLHQRDNDRLIATLQRLRDIGNTVVVVEHDRETIEAADLVADFGPGAGSLGGKIVFVGTPAELVQSTSSLTGQYMAGTLDIPTPKRRRKPGAKVLRVRGARENNLRNLDIEFPLGLLIAVTGVSGAGKSSLIEQILSPALHNGLHHARRPVGDHDGIDGIEHLGKVIDIDQGPIGRSPRSNPATYTKAFDEIRTVFAATREARVQGYSPMRFSFNKKGGRCEACKGDGFRRIEMHFLADVYVPCEVCGGSRFNEATVQVRYQDKTIADVLKMTVDEALLTFQNHRRIRPILQTLADVGLGYLQLGQPSNTLSGGEAQRIKLSRELARRGEGHTLYLLDEPTTGLHFDDIRRLMTVLDALVSHGNTVIIVEHNLDVLKCADWIVDLGPEGGAGGGQLVALGSPEEVAGIEGSYTGQYLKSALRV